MAKQVTAEDIRKLQYRCKTDLFFLSREVLGYRDLTERTHRELCDFFVKKDPAKDIYEQDQVKDRLLLAPRGAFKSTLDICDAVQWIICFPNIRILILTGAMDLAEMFVAEAQEHFTVRGEPTNFQKLFAEFCIEPKQQLVGRFTVPCRTKWWREPTLLANSIDSNLSGMHFEIGKADDPVTNRNSKTETNCQEVTRVLHVNWKMVHPEGYRDQIGTRYTPIDAHQHAIANSQEGEIKVLIKQAWRLKPEIERDIRNGTMDPRELEASDCEWLMFPEKLSFKFLKKELIKDLPSFYSQYMNDPVVAGNVIFTLDLLRNATVPHMQLPKEGEVRVTWDLAQATSKASDYSAGAVTRAFDGRIYVEDVVHGRYVPSELASKIVLTAQRWGTHNVGIEKSPGAIFLGPELARKSQEYSWPVLIEWIETDKSLEAKRKRVHAIEPLVRSQRLIFSSAINCMDELYEQFTCFGSVAHDDIPDAIALACRNLPRTEAQSPQVTKAWEDLQKKDLHDRLFGLGKYTPAPAPPPRQDSYGMEPIIPGVCH